MVERHQPKYDQKIHFINTEPKMMFLWIEPEVLPVVLQFWANEVKRSKTKVTIRPNMVNNDRSPKIYEWFANISFILR